jgi:hypothetical protein
VSDERCDFAISTCKGDAVVDALSKVRYAVLEEVVGDLHDCNAESILRVFGDGVRLTV